MKTLRRNYDLAVTASSAAVLLALGVPWPLWIAWAGILAYQIGNRVLAHRDAR